MKKIKLTKDYTNWWDIAGDIYGGVTGQRAYAILKAANPGLNRFSRATTINVPDIDPSKVYLSHSQVAAERKEYDYNTWSPNQNYWNALGKTAPSGTLAAQPTVYSGGQSGTQAQASGGVLYNGQPWEGLAPVRYAGKYSPEQRAQLIAQARYMPQVQDDYTNYQLPQEQYEYFYGSNPARAVDERNAMLRQREMLRRQQAEQRAAGGMYDPRRGRGYTQPYASSEKDQQFRQGMYGARYERPVYRSTTDEQKLREGMYGAQYNRMGQAKMEEDWNKLVLSPYVDYPELQPAKKAMAKDYGKLSTRLNVNKPAYRPYTTDWLDDWLLNNKVDLSNPDSIAELNDETQWMLAVVGAIEPVEFAEIANNGGGYGGGGYGGGYYGGGYGYGGSGRSYAGGYNYPDYERAAQRYANSLGLISWRI